MTSTLDRIEQRLPGPMIIALIWMLAGILLGQTRAAATILAMAAPVLLITRHGRRMAMKVFATSAAGVLMAMAART